MRVYASQLDALLTPIAPIATLRASAIDAERLPLLLRVARRGRNVSARAFNRLQHALTPPAPAIPAPARQGPSARLLALIASQHANNLTPTRTRPRVIHVIGSLAAGGAERQLVYVARESQRRGNVEARILTTHATEHANGHYLPLAVAGGVTVENAGYNATDADLAQFTAESNLHQLLADLPLAYRAWVADLAGEFIRLRPNVVHAWLDHTNMWAGIAALATGVPHIILSTRNVNPSHFPTIDYPDFLPWYRAFATSPRVRFIGNSHAGAADYARWIGIDPNRFTVIVNGFDPTSCTVPSEAEAIALRAELGVGREPVILGVFRLAEEKQPFVFLDAASRVVDRVPHATVLIAGDGPMRKDVEAAIAARGDNRIRLLGRREDVSALLSIATVVLHASRQEGTSNTLIETQALGCPVVATRAGGTADAVEDGGSGYLCDVGDANTLASRVCEILGDDALRERMSKRAKAFATETFDLCRMVDATLALYPMEQGS